jgi:hypothetical protein
MAYKTTNRAWLIALGGLAAYEAWTLSNKVKDDTLSEAAWDIISERPLVPFIAGGLTGHFIAGSRKTTWMTVAAFSAGFVSAVVFWREKAIPKEIA